MVNNRVVKFFDDLYARDNYPAISAYFYKNVIDINVTVAFRYTMKFRNVSRSIFVTSFFREPLYATKSSINRFLDEITYF